MVAPCIIVRNKRVFSGFDFIAMLVVRHGGGRCHGDTATSGGGLAGQDDTGDEKLELSGHRGVYEEQPG